VKAHLQGRRTKDRTDSPCRKPVVLSWAERTQDQRQCTPRVLRMAEEDMRYAVLLPTSWALMNHTLLPLLMRVWAGSSCRCNVIDLMGGRRLQAGVMMLTRPLLPEGSSSCSIPLMKM